MHASLKDKWVVANNIIVCTTHGAGITSLSCGDLDGDIVLCAQNESLIRYVESMEIAMEDIPSNAATEAKQERKAWKQQTAHEYLTHMGDIPTLSAWNCDVDCCTRFYGQGIFCHTTDTESHVVGEHPYVQERARIKE